MFKNLKEKKTTAAGIISLVVVLGGLALGLDEEQQGVLAQNLDKIVAGVTALILMFKAKD